MHEIAGIPYTTAEFNEKGECIHPPTVPDATRELIVVSHGWNNNADEALGLYAKLFGNFAKVNPGGKDGIAILGVIWPSKTFDFSVDAADQDKAELAAAGIGGHSVAAQDAAIATAFAKFEHVFADSGKEQELEALRGLIGRIEQPAAQKEFVIALRTILEAPADKSALDASNVFFGTQEPREMFKKAEQIRLDVNNHAGPAAADAGHAAGLGSLFGGVANAVGSLLNLTTYYEMKERAGTVGAKGLAPLLDGLAKRDTLRHIHLVGHSFGARLVTAAAMASTTDKLHSMSLLQAAFSQNGFSKNLSGYFRKVVDPRRLSGPVIITHTPNDKAVGKAYAIASRLSGVDAAGGVGSATDKFGGLGGNGALNMEADEVSPTVTKMLKSGAAYDLKAHTIHNLESSPYIANHGDVAGEEVAWAISQAIATAAAPAAKP